MPPSNRSSSEMERRGSTRNSRRLSLDEDDGYSLGAMGISDGFRPTMTEASTSRSRTSSQTLRHERRSTPPPRPSSNIKPKGLDSFALRHDGAMGSLSRPAEAASASNRASVVRLSSASTDTVVVRAESPYDGPTGPSHPYQMYPQNIRLARTASVATSTFQPSERQYTGPLGPTHPYGMYPQNTISESETVHDQLPVASIPVGFPGRSDQYQRRLGPDGEEVGDIIGPLGHTEQLPPYTQFPDEVFSRKAAPVIPPGAGGIGLATRNPEFASREDLTSAESRHSTRSFVSDSDHQINVAALRSLEKSQEKKWKVIARRKVWGIVPIWVFVLVGIIFLIFAIIIGAVVGSIMKHKHDGGSRSADTSVPVIYSTITTTIDATPLTSLPTNMPKIPTGTYSLPLSTPLIADQSCLDSPSLYSSWSCDTPSSSPEIIVSLVNESTNKMRDVKISIFQANNSLKTYFYGPQPLYNAVDEIMTLAQDTSKMSFGTAWFFQAPYDKLVVVPENNLPRPSNKRSIEWLPQNDPLMHRRVAQSGDKPWFCYWNNTLLEIFIYVNRSSPSWTKDTAGLPYRVAVTASRSALTNPSVSRPFGGPTSTPTVSPTTGGKPQDYPSYPNQIKIEENRIDQSVEPYCVQMKILGDGSAVTLKSSSGSPIIIKLKETKSTTQRMSRKRSPTADSNPQDYGLVERGEVDSCRCIWLSA